jgi:hypothetical protein
MTCLEFAEVLAASLKKDEGTTSEVLAESDGQGPELLKHSR